MDHLLFSRVRTACMKAVMYMIEKRVSANTLTAAAIAARILDHFQVPYMPIAGYCHMEGCNVSIPHVWLVSPNTGAAAGEPHDIVTDLTFSEVTPERMIVILGSGIGLTDGAFKASYDASARFQVVKALPIEVLDEQSRDLNQYIANIPPSMAKLRLAITEIIANCEMF